MKLKTRLTISFFIIMFVPIVLAGFTFMCFWKVQIKALEQTYGFDDSDYSYLMNSVQLLNRYTIKDYGRINGDSGNIFDFPNYCQPILIDYLVKKLELSKF